MLNDLDRLAPIGVIDVRRVDLLTTLEVTAPDGWYWLENFDKYITSHEPLSTIACLCKSRYLRVTYRNITEDVARLRIYAVPVDVDGRRFLLPIPKVSVKKIRYIFELINNSPAAWNGHLNTDFKPLLRHPPKAAPSLSEMFNSVSATPDDTKWFDQCDDEELVSRILEGDIEGMKSDLYPYQRESVAAMLTKELNPRRSIVGWSRLRLQMERGSTWILKLVIYIFSRAILMV